MIAPILQPALSYGALLSAWMTFIILASLRHDPRIWQDDAPQPIRAQLGPLPPATKRRRLGWGLIMAVGVVALAAGLMQALPNTTPIPARLLAAYLMFEVFNLYDAVVIDLGVLLVWAPDWAYPPGMKGHPSLRDRRFHLRNFAIGLLAGLAFAGAVVGIWAALRVT